MREGANSLEITSDRDYFVVWDFTDIDFRNLGVQVSDKPNQMMKRLTSKIEKSRLQKSQRFSANDVNFNVRNHASGPTNQEYEQNLNLY